MKQSRLLHQFIDKGSDKLIIVFHSRQPDGWTSFFGEPQRKFDFYKIVNSFDVSALFFMDTDQNWYQDLFHEVFDIANSILARHEYRFIYTMGASFGGYAAIVTATQLARQIATCLAFAPQTDLRESTTLTLQNQLGEPTGFIPFANQSHVKDTRYFDCKPLLDHSPETRFHIIYSNDSLWDEYYGKYLGSSEQVFCDGYPCKDHNIGAHLLQKGILISTITEALSVTIAPESQH